MLKHRAFYQILSIKQEELIMIMVNAKRVLAYLALLLQRVIGADSAGAAAAISQQSRCLSDA